MRGPVFNKYRMKYKYMQFKHHCKYYGYRIKEGARQIFIPLAIFQLIRTLLFPTPLDVFILVIIFLIIITLLLDWF